MTYDSSSNTRGTLRVQGFMVRVLLAAAAVLALGAAPAAAQPAGKGKKGERARPIVLDKVVAVVNSDVILHSELLTRSAPLVADLGEIADSRDRARREKKIVSQVLDDMINEELMVQAAVESKLQVKPEEIQSALEEIKRQNKLDDKGLADALSMQGYSIASYKKDVKRQILRMRAVNMLVRPRVTITDDDLRARYDEMSRRSASVSKVHLHHILIALPDKPSEAELAAAKNKAGELVQRARAGEPFAELAKKYSDDDSTRDVGGDLGDIERGSIATEWEAVVFAMDEGEVRGPISGPRGLHVFYVSELTKSDLKKFDELKEQIRNELYRKEMDRQTRQWMNELRKKAHIVRK